jgi:hypothetical protein
MADLKMQSTDGKVLIDVNAGFGGFHSATIVCGGMKLVFTAQQLVDYLAPFIEEKAESYVAPASAAPPDSAA